MTVRGLISKNIPTIAIVIGDSSNGLNTKNTINTLASLDGIAKTNKKPLSIIYVNNAAMPECTTTQQAEQKANKVLTNILSTVSLFLSGENEALDNQDMFGIIDQSHYTTIGVEPGLYGLTVHSKVINLPEGAIPTVGRSLTLEGHDFDTGLTLLHHKRGYVTSENAIAVSNKDNFPLHMVSCANFFNTESANLSKVDADYDNIMNNIKNSTLSGTTKSKVDEATGLIF